MASIPTRGPTATRDGILALAREGERLGLHSAMIADHIVFPVESRSTYPYTVDGKHPSTSTSSTRGHRGFPAAAKRSVGSTGRRISAIGVGRRCARPRR